MPGDEQLLDADLDHLGAGHGADPPAEPDLGAGEPEDVGDAGDDAQADGEHEKLRRVPRDAVPGDAAVHSIFRRAPDGPDVHRRRDPVADAVEPDQLPQAGEDGQGDPRHPAVPEHGVPAAAGGGPAGLRAEQHAGGGGRARDVRAQPGGRAARARGREDREVWPPV
ncbi:hypothetical protein LOZ07_004666 [Ophidiomyces ophidiicola]|nr:hypothetical protein LOZ07_004666 [Ophidiomyces ophidiicola]